MTDPLDGQLILVLGMARQGQALARWLPEVGARVIVSDSKTAEQLGVSPGDYPDVTLELGNQSEELLDGVDALCISGGVPLNLPIVQAAQAFNSARNTFPRNIIASTFGTRFAEKAYFKAQAGAETAPKVQF